MRPLVRAAVAAALLAALPLATTGCAEPPSKEMHLAQGAIDAARAAGAERYAPEEYRAAVDALRRSEEAAAQRDYRLALNHALDSRERAQNAARDASSARAQARGQAERTLAEVTTTLSAATAKLESARTAKIPAKTLTRHAETIASAQRAVQEAGTLLGREEYREAQKVLEARAPALIAATREMDTAMAAAAARPKRPSRRPR